MACAKCNIELTARNRSGLCRPCYVQRVVDSKKKPIPHCTACSVEIGRRSRLLLCNPCYHKERAKRPGMREKMTEAVRKMRAKDPEKHRRIALEWQRANPERTREIRAKTVSGLKNRYSRAIWRAKRRKLSWKIPKDSFAHLIAQPCTYCSGKLDSSGCGLDRLDNSKGYEPGNVVPSCGKCNRIRGDRLTHEEMRAAMSAVLSLRNKKRLYLVDG